MGILKKMVITPLLLDIIYHVKKMSDLLLRGIFFTVQGIVKFAVSFRNDPEGITVHSTFKV